MGDVSVTRSHPSEAPGSSREWHTLTDTTEANAAQKVGRVPGGRGGTYDRGSDLSLRVREGFLE